LALAKSRGLLIPVVYNSSGYEKADILRYLEGTIDIYLPDLKYHDAQLSEKYSGAPDYFETAAQAIIEMYCQQPCLELAKNGFALKGLIIRHMIIPGNTEDSINILNWIADNLSLSIGLSLMSQYTPCHQAPPEIQRSLNAQEYQCVVEYALTLGFQNLYIQPEPFAREENLIPDFNRLDPFVWNNKDRIKSK